jgi:acetate kinase
MRTLGLSLEEAERQLTKESGLLGLSGVSNDIRDINEAAANGNADAALALDVLIHSIRHWIGAFLIELGGLDALVFTAGIGENGKTLRARVCEGLEAFGIRMDPQANEDCRATEAFIQAENSTVKIMVIPANEELVLAREVFRKLS